MDTLWLSHTGLGRREPKRELPLLRTTAMCLLKSEGFWRPWVLTPKDAERLRVQNVELHSPDATEDSVKLAQYTHPVRLFWPKSKCFDYMYHEAEALLRNFPVQATIFFYDESENEEDSDGTDHESEAEVDS
ncbi:hypothetical protein Chor_006845 [Crotalus horridus]